MRKFERGTKRETIGNDAGDRGFRNDPGHERRRHEQLIGGELRPRHARFGDLGQARVGLATVQGREWCRLLVARRLGRRSQLIETLDAAGQQAT